MKILIRMRRDDTKFIFDSKNIKMFFSVVRGVKALSINYHYFYLPLNFS